jgi:CCR4-NOT transcriptional regulation complex NOT5 subunit
MIDMKKYLLFLLLLTSTCAFAAITKWVDSDGRVHYSDQPPPPNAQQKTLRSDDDTQVSQNASDVAAPKTIAEREADTKKAQIAKKEAADKAAQQQAIAAARQANCANAQQNLRILQDGTRIRVVDANGQPSYIDDNERAQRIEKVQNDVNTYCK